jgi:WD40 repeat protein
MSVRQLITDLLINEYGLQGINFPLFEKMNEEGLFLLIFDGFDEMAQKVIFDVAYSNFSKIAELAEPKKSKVMLTCRTEFFRTHEQEKEILLDIDKRKNFGIIYLREFDDEQIKKFLQKRVPLIEKQKKVKGWKYYYQRIQEIFDLKDLAKRPVLLELIVKYLPQLVKKGEKINASTLYDTTIHEEIKRRLKVGKTVIKRDDRIKLMKLLATWMYNHDKLSLYYKDIPELLDLKAHFDLKPRTDIEYHLNDFLTCSFLNRDTEGNYRFSHKSFVDFLVASKFKDDIEKDYKNDFFQKTITYEVMQFMKNFEINKDKLYEWIESTKKRSFSETQYLGGNAVSILSKLGENFAERRFDFSETVLDYVNFHGQDLQGLNFKNTSMRYANLNSTNLADTNFSFADLKGATFEEMDRITLVCWSPDGKYLASGDEGGILRVWNKIGFEEVATLKGHAEEIIYLAFSPDGKYLASGSLDRAKIWDIETFKEAVLEGHTEGIPHLAFSPDGKYLASGSLDRAKIWDIETFKEAVLEGHTKRIPHLAFSPDGKYLASGSLDKTIKIWDADPKSKTFGKCQHTLMLQINCKRMKIRGAKGLNKEKISFLEARGAII